MLLALKGWRVGMVPTPAVPRTPTPQVSCPEDSGAPGGAALGGQEGLSSPGVLHAAIWWLHVCPLPDCFQVASSLASPRALDAHAQPCAPQPLGCPGDSTLTGDNRDP